MKKVNVLIIMGFAMGFSLLLMTGTASAADLEDLDVTIRVVEPDADVNEVENELQLPESASDSASEHAEDSADDHDGKDDMDEVDREDQDEVHEDGMDTHEDGVEDSSDGTETPDVPDGN